MDIEPHILDVTFFRNYRGPFAHTRARLDFVLLTSSTSGFIVAWERFELLSPSTWFRSRIEICPVDDDRGIGHVKEVPTAVLEDQLRHWYYTWPIRQSTTPA